jgi:hypothetical protein
MSRPIEIALADVVMPLDGGKREALRDLADSTTSITLADILDDAANVKTVAMREALRLGKHEDARACEAYASACEDVAALLRDGLADALKPADDSEKDA